MHTDDMLMREIQWLYASERSLVAAFDAMQGRVRFRKTAVAIVMLIDAADRHMAELERIGGEQGWTMEGPECSLVQAWRAEVEARLLGSCASPETDMEAVSLLLRAVHLKIPCYETARLLAFYAERPLIARSLRHALEDEHACVERLRNAAELGVSFRAVLG